MGDGGTFGSKILPQKFSLTEGENHGIFSFNKGEIKWPEKRANPAFVLRLARIMLPCALA
jgi:hypothetical protein